MLNVLLLNQTLWLLMDALTAIAKRPWQLAQPTSLNQSQPQPQSPHNVTSHKFQDVNQQSNKLLLNAITLILLVKMKDLTMPPSLNALLENLKSKTLEDALNVSVMKTWLLAHQKINQKINAILDKSMNVQKLYKPLLKSAMPLLLNQEKNSFMLNLSDASLTNLLS